MSLKNTATRYGSVARALHWSMALLIITLIAMGFWMGTLSEISEIIYYVNLHKSLGIIALFLGILRIVWRFVSPPPPLPADQPAHEKLAAHTAHLALYLMFIVQPAVGIVHSWATGYPIVFFNISPLPALMAPDKGLAEILGATHFYVGWALVFVIAAHAAAALKHHFIDKDDVLLRMLPHRAPQNGRDE
ncbi:cytochrome b [Kiloniella sp. b19]|uniref:cytochrome b n=1 Tax=Kiloniella sp. GXU_MW_B19 TaxID=3141326 RepID=UPI0031D78136